MAGDSQTQISVYRVRLRFERLFADPIIFEEPAKLVQRYLASAGTSSELLGYMQQMARELVAVDDSGKPSVIAGTAEYQHQGKRVRSEYMKEANLEIGYVDFGSGLSREDHEKLWRKSRWGEMKFNVKALEHENIVITLPDVAELYGMLRERATPTTLASVELTDVPEALFDAAVGYLENRLKQLAEGEGAKVEVYAAKRLASEEKQALEKRLARDSTPATVHVLLSKTGFPAIG